MVPPNWNSALCNPADAEGIRPPHGAIAGPTPQKPLTIPALKQGQRERCIKNPKFRQKTRKTDEFYRASTPNFHQNDTPAGRAVESKMKIF